MTIGIVTFLIAFFGMYIFWKSGHAAEKAGLARDILAQKIAMLYAADPMQGRAQYWVEWSDAEAGRRMTDAMKAAYGVTK